ncbi:MAG TPA: hypothetical protein ENK85_04315 [Saprospiraceae bacterium]|nr:hypothetical protein [Saprospiraceae bacterium]
MELFKPLMTLFVLVTLMTTSSCKKEPVCISSDLELEETLIEIFPNQNMVNIYFDVTNHSGTDYNENDTLVSIVRSKIQVVTQDGSMYESVDYLPFDYLSAGATKSAKFTAVYGIGKEFQSYSISLFCD